MNTVVSVENLSKRYRLGQINTGSFTHDLNLWWAKVRGKPNPILKINEMDHGNRDGNELWALCDLNFNVHKGEVLGIIGRNGAGKSTLLKILSRVTAPTTGQVKIRGKIASLLEVGTGFHPDLTGRENIYLNGAILGMNHKEIDRKFDEIVDFAEIEPFIDTPVKRYSNGMYVRLAFAVAAHLDSEILLLDEVLAVGDAGFQRKCLGKMGEVAKYGRTILFVSHNLSAVNSLCNRCVLLKSGKVGSIGKVKNIIDKYLSNNNYISNNLLDRTDRNGNGEAKFSKIIITKGNENKIKSEFQTGDTIQIEVIILSSSELEVFIGIEFRDLLGKTITCFNTRESGFLPLLRKGVNKLILRIPRIQLLEGNYLINGSIVKTTNAVYCDRVENIQTVSIFPNDIFKTGAPFRARHGVVFMPHTWKGPNKEYLSVRMK